LRRWAPRSWPIRAGRARDVARGRGRLDSAIGRRIMSSPADARGRSAAQSADASDGRPSPIDRLRVKIFADGAELSGMLALYRIPSIRGFTTNPTLMHKAGVDDYRRFAREVLAAIPDRPISFEVFSDEIPEMERQAREIATWGPCVYVKIPVTNTQGQSTADLIHRLSHAGVRINVTAVLTIEQVRDVVNALRDGAPSNVSGFAGPIA